MKKKKKRTLESSGLLSPDKWRRKTKELLAEMMGKARPVAWFWFCLLTHITREQVSHPLLSKKTLVYKKKLCLPPPFFVLLLALLLRNQTMHAFRFDLFFFSRPCINQMLPFQLNKETTPDLDVLNIKLTAICIWELSFFSFALKSRNRLTVLTPRFPWRYVTHCRYFNFELLTWYLNRVLLTNYLLFFFVSLSHVLFPKTET